MRLHTYIEVIVGSTPIHVSNFCCIGWLKWTDTSSVDEQAIARTLTSIHVNDDVDRDGNEDAIISNASNVASADQEEQQSTESEYDEEDIDQQLEETMQIIEQLKKRKTEQRRRRTRARRRHDDKKFKDKVNTRYRAP